MQTTTHGIEYPDGTDPITDYPGVAASAAATIDALLTGWIPLGAVLTFGAVDGHTSTATAPVDLTASISAGMRLRLVHGGVTKYFLVTAVAFAGGTTTITLYGGTDYVLAAGAITLPYFSPHKAPVGFPVDPAKWTETLTDTTARTQASPAANTWYNPGSVSIAVPIGAWFLEWSAPLEMQVGGDMDVYGTLSTANNTESDTELTAIFRNAISGASGATIGRRKSIVLAAKTSYFLNTKVDGAGGTLVGYRGDTNKIIVRAVSAYL